MKGLVDKGLVGVKHRIMERDRICEQLHGIWTRVHEYQPTRFVIDNITSLDGIMVEEEIDDYLRTWYSSLAAEGITVLLTTQSRSATSLAGDEISRLVDNTIFLKDTEVEGSLRRSLAILKARGLAHDTNIRDLDITPQGVMIKKKTFTRTDLGRQLQCDCLHRGKGNVSYEGIERVRIG